MLDVIHKMLIRYEEGYLARFQAQKLQSAMAARKYAREQEKLNAKEHETKASHSS